MLRKTVLGVFKTLEEKIDSTDRRMGKLNQSAKFFTP